jgi:hypothetical protein
MHSISKNHVAFMLEKDGEKHRENFVQFTGKHLCRSFPSWKDKQDVNPTIQHALGCQIVPMHFQTSDESLLVNDGRFRANDSCGYVLKPNPKHLSRVDEREKRYQVSILSGRYLPKPESSLAKKGLVLRPFVKVSLYEGDPKGPFIVHKTDPIIYNGINPVWGTEKDTFELIVTRPSIAILLISVWDATSNDFIAGSAVPVSCLREGYRSVSLFDSLHTRCGSYAFASLFVNAVKTSS